jgi:hypothetical protein
MLHCTRFVKVGGGVHWSRFIAGEGPTFHLINSTSPLFHVLSGAGKMVTQKRPMVRIVHNTNEAVQQVTNLFEKHGCSKASVVQVT